MIILWIQGQRAMEHKSSALGRETIEQLW